MDSLAKLRLLNFSRLLELAHTSPAHYTFSEYCKNGFRHPSLRRFCTECERLNCHTYELNKKVFRLQNISHGTHAADFLASVDGPVETVGWHEEPVLFIYESPSLDYNIYETVEIEGIKKRPTKLWYWIHEKQKPYKFPDEFSGFKYGTFILSCILTFQLKNAYVTNLVKCGLNTEDGDQFLGLAHFDAQCVRSCIRNYLQKEVDILQPKVIFAFGARVYSWVTQEVRTAAPIHQLPHPAGARRGFKNIYFRILYFWQVAIALHRTGVLTTSEMEELGRIFVREYKDA